MADHQELPSVTAASRHGRPDAMTCRCGDACAKEAPNRSGKPSFGKPAVQRYGLGASASGGPSVELADGRFDLAEDGRSVLVAVHHPGEAVHRPGETEGSTMERLSSRRPDGSVPRQSVVVRWRSGSAVAGT